MHKQESAMLHEIADIMSHYVNDDSFHGDWDEQRICYLSRMISSAVSDSIHALATAEIKCDSPIESIVYMRLQELKTGSLAVNKISELLISTQVSIGDYTADFVVSRSDKSVVIECDGHDFHEKTKKQAAHDKKRDRELQKLGFHVLRYTGMEIVQGRIDLSEDLESIFFTDER